MILLSKSSIHPSMLGNTIVKQDKLKKLKNFESFMTPQQNQVKCSYAGLSLVQYMISSDIQSTITNLNWRIFVLIFLVLILYHMANTP